MICVACRWDNDVDSGPCAGCGHELGAAAPVPVEMPGPAPPTVVEESPRAEEEPRPEEEPRVFPGPVTIRPVARPTPQVVDPMRGGPRPVQPGRAAPVARTSSESGRREPPPVVRSIPVVIAPAGERAVVRRRGESADTAAATLTEPIADDVLRPGDSLCPSCGRSVPGDRRFCRCGARLPVPPGQGSDAAVPEKADMSRSAFRSAQRLANGGRRPRYDAPLALRTRVLRALAALVLIGAVGSQVPPWGDDVRSWLDTRVDQVVASR